MHRFDIYRGFAEDSPEHMWWTLTVQVQLMLFCINAFHKYTTCISIRQGAQKMSCKKQPFLIQSQNI